MGKHKTRAEARQESGTPVIGATFDTVTSRKIAGFVGGLQELAPGLVESINRRPIVRVMGAKTVSRLLREYDFSVRFPGKLPLEGLSVTETGELVISMKDNDSMVRLARCAAVGAMQELSGDKSLKVSDLTEITDGQITPEATIATVNTRSLDEFKELFTDNPAEALGHLVWSRRDKRYKPNNHRLPTMLGFDSLVLTRLVEQPHFPKDYRPYTRAPSKQFARHLYIEGHNPSGMGLAS